MVYHPTYCTVLNEEGIECMAPLLEDVPVSVCKRHLMLAALMARERGWLKNLTPPRVVRMPVYIPISEQWRKRLASNAQPIPEASYQVVYYLRFGDRIKIGTTTNLPERLKSIPHDEVIGLEPGGFATEHARHVEFAKDRIHHEWFHPSPRLLKHIQGLRNLYGDAIESWTAVPMGGRSKKREKKCPWSISVSEALLK